MKKVLSGAALRIVMEEAINMLGDAVSSTLGPSGNNVLINNDDMAPFITNDGVTIASSIESDNKEINTILEIAKESSFKTNELVGDGTTTTIVLLQSLFNEGVKLLEKNKNAIILKKELDESLEIVLNELDKLKRIPTSKDLTEVARTSCNDYELGKFVSELFSKVKSKYAIKLDESNDEKTYYEVKKGYSLELDNISNMYFVNNSEIVLNDTYILVLKGYLDDLEKIADLINEGIKDKNIVIFAEDISENVKEEALLYFLEYHKNIFLFNLPDYAARRYAIETDLVNITNATIRNIDHDLVCFEDFGKSSKLVINQNEILIAVDNDINDYLLKLKEELNNCFNDYEKEFLARRVSSLDNGIATIYVGSPTKTEIKEKKMRIEDAINALDIASIGVVVGSGVSLLKVKDLINLNSDGANILKLTLEEPFKKIMENCGEDYNKYKELIIKFNYEKVYNLKTRKFENIKNTSVLDPIEVIKISLKNAISIASMLLTTNYLVINENLKENKEDYL